MLKIALSMMVGVLVAGLLFFAPAARDAQAAERLEITSLDLGSCWARAGADQQWDIRSKNDSRVFGVGAQFEQRAFNDALITRMKDLSIEHYAAGAYVAYLHCGGGGATLLLTLADAALPLCAAITPARQALGAEEISIYANPEGAAAELCSGVEGETLIVKPSSRAPGLFDRLLRDATFGRIVQGVSAIGAAGEYYELKLRPAYRFKVAEAKRMIETDPLTRAFVDSISYNGINYIVGESMRLGTYEFSGY